MADKRIKDLGTTITAFRTGDVIAVDGPSGTAKMPADRIAERNDVGYTYVKNTSDGSVNLSETFTSGQKILVVVYTDSDVTATINGNVIFSDSSVQYPTISIVNGFGYKELTYNKDGHLGTFGGAGVSGKKVVFKVVVCDEAGESALYSLLELHQKNLSAITTNAGNISNNTREIAKNDGIEYVKNTSDGSVNLSETFTSGQKILIVATTDSDITANINGNVIFTDSTTQYPTISVVNGFGYKELTYNKDGHLGTFGGAGVSGKKVVFKVVVCDEEGESALYSLFELHKKNVSAITTNASNISDNAREIAKNDGVEYIKNTSDGSVNLSETFTSGQKILVVAYTDSDVTATINGNVAFTDSTLQYPTISVVNGFGYKELTYNKDGHLGTFGGAGVSGKKVVFKVVVCDEEGESTLYGLINAIKEIADLHVEQTQNVFASFKKIAIVGDSLGSGESVYKDSSNQLHYVDNYDYSWIQIMAKQNGQTAYNFSKGGEWCADWLDPSNTRGITMAQSNPADCYFIGLGHNDSHVDRQETQPLGTIADVNVGSEGSNPSTFYGNYSKIIASLKAITNRCRIFCVTSPSLESSAPQFNQAIRDVAALYQMCYVLELGGDPYYASSFIESQKYAGHYSAAAYAAMATHINEILNDYIISHPSYFRGIQWIGTNYDVVGGG
ncbi:MAG: SGNH/GDSL hydrolase family protein [Prevotella sp.]|nr:SGNH/GDSL hydrolase family protein [Prevotella sp.]